MRPVHRQQAIGGHALVGHHAKQLARGQACIVNQQLETAAAWKALAQFPGINRGNSQAQVLRNLLERDLLLSPPIPERGRKAGTNITFRLCLN